MKPALFQRVKKMILKHVPTDVAGREAWIASAWGMDTPLANRVDFPGNREVFTTNLLTLADTHGTLDSGQWPVVALLAHLSEQVGSSERDKIFQLVMDLEQDYNQHAPVMRLHDVFLSYGRKDTHLMRYVRKLMFSEGLSVWTDETMEPGTPDWVAEVSAAVREAGCLVVLYSKHSVKSKWVKREVLGADQMNKRIFPVMLDDTEIPFEVVDRQVIFWDDDPQAFRDVLIPPIARHLGIETPTTQRLKVQKSVGATAASSPAPTPSQPDPVQATRRVAPTPPKPTKPRSDQLLPAPFEWIKIPAGRVTLKGGVYGDGQTFDVAAFEIAKYPVTNAQYALFVQAGGYTDRQWWTDAGWESRLAGYVWNGSKREYEATGNPWTEPRFWQDEKWNGADYPVVGVSWYEVIAFSRWLSAQTGENITLPTEQQWQRAAQGDDNRTYPWGDDFDETRCNTRESGIGRTTPVTQYADVGASPFGVVDMAGNVWEWSLTEYESGSNDINSTSRRALRGGSWYGNHYSARAAYRNYAYNPYSRFNYYGVRFVRSPS